MSSDDLDDDINSLTAGFVGVEDFLAISIGRLANQELEPTMTGVSEEGPWGRFAGEDGATATMFLDPARGVLSRLQVSDGDGEIRLIMTHTEHMLVEDIWFPQQTIYQLVGTELEVEFNYSGWDRLGSIPNAFGVSAPAGADVLSFSELMERMSTVDIDELADEDSAQLGIADDELNPSTATPSVDLQ